MKAIITKETSVHCDACHHEFSDAPAAWHNKPCPVCGAPNIINDEDMEMWAGMNNVMDLVNNLFDELPEQRKGEYLDFSFDTAAMRGAEKPRPGDG